MPLFGEWVEQGLCTMLILLLCMPAHVGAKRSLTRARQPLSVVGFCRLELDRWPMLQSHAVQAHMLGGLML
jgi:hypothetical protein